MPLQKVARVRFEGERGDEEQRIVLVLRNGSEEKAVMQTGSSSSPHQDAVGGGSSGRRFTGLTNLGPFSILGSDVRDSNYVDELIHLSTDLLYRRGVSHNYKGHS